MNNNKKMLRKNPLSYTSKQFEKERNAVAARERIPPSPQERPAV